MLKTRSARSSWGASRELLPPHLKALVAGAEAHQLHVLGEQPMGGGQHQVGALLEVQPPYEAD